MAKYIDKIKLAGQTLEFVRDCVRVRDWPHPFYTPFRTQSKPDLRFEIKRVEKFPELLSSKSLLFDGDANWKLYRDGEQYRLELFDSASCERDRCVFLSADFTFARVLVTQAQWKTQKLYRPMIEVILLHYFASRQGLLVHGAAIRDGERAFLFIGESGAGKTTMSEFWGTKEGDISVLGDERTLIKKRGDQWYACGTPWPGLGFVIANETVPVSQIFFISHGAKNQIVPAHPAVLFQKLFTQCFSPFWNADLLAQQTDTCEEIIRTVPCSLLPFIKDPCVTDFIREVTQQSHAAYA